MVVGIIVPIIIGVLSIIGSIITIVTVINFIRFKVDFLDAREKEFKITLDETTKELRDIINRLGIVIAEQGVVNKFTTDLLNNLTHRIERNEKLLADYATTLNVIKELMDRKRQ